MPLKKIIYLPEGDWQDPLNYSGTPSYFGQALIKMCQSHDIDLGFALVPEMINTEPFLALVESFVQKSKVKDPEAILASLSTVQREHCATKTFLDAMRSVSAWTDAIPPIQAYISALSTLTEKRLVAEQADQPDVAVFSLNTMNPPLSPKHRFPRMHYYLDTPLAPFYFSPHEGFVGKARQSPPIVDIFVSLEKNAIEQAASLFFFSQYAANLCQEFHSSSRDKMRVVGAGANLDDMPIWLERNYQAPLRVLFIGRDFSAKGGDLLLEVAKALDPKRFVMTIVTEERFHPNNPSEIPAAIFLPPQPKPKVIDLYQNHDIFVFPTLLDAFGLVVCEAMAFGLPVIGRKVRAIPEIIGSPPSHFNPYVSNPIEMIKALEALEKDTTLMRNIAYNNHLKAEKQFTWEKVIHKMLDSYNIGKGYVDE